MDSLAEKPREDRLNAVLGEWRGVKPPANFEAAVWGRIRAVSASESFGGWLARILGDAILPPSAWATSMAAALAILIGVLWAGQGRHQADEPLLHSRTLAGAYLAMATGGTR